MTATLVPAEYVDANPLDLLEQVADIRNWAFDRCDEQEMNLAVAGNWRDYQIALNWRDDFGGLHMATTLEVRVPPERRRAVRDLLGLINEQLWSGHFDMWSEDGTILFRDTLLLCGGAAATPEQCEALLHLAVEACDRYYSAINYVIWAGKSPEEAIAAALFETQGTA